MPEPRRDAGALRAPITGLGRVRRVYFIGIGGSGMCGIAQVLLHMGYAVSGSDLHRGASVRTLEALGARVFEGHARGRVADCDVVVVSSAIPADNPEWVEARELRIPVIPRAEMLGELMRMKYAVAVAGSHGKTSTTSMVATTLTRSDCDPTVVIGGRLEILGSHARWGGGQVLVAEADESDGSFLRLYPTVAVVTGIDREHLDHYGDFEAVKKAFVAFLRKVPFYGKVIACLDDEGVQDILPRLDRRIVTYGFTPQADYRVTSLEIDGFETRFEFRHGQGAAQRVRLATPGRHQVLNALAALAVADELGVPIEQAAEALDGFRGADRRMQRIGEAGGVLVVDDYGHHPREIEATLGALREAVGDRRIVVLFQPHRYSRLEALFDAFCRAFHQAEVVLLTDLYAAGESPREGIDAQALAEGLARHGHRDATWVGPLDAAIDAAAARLEASDVLLTLGAGSVSRAAPAIVERLAKESTR
ncbi:MAG: UDP-N-acetylmuramate--L-alanine ligase [Acidobacteriota bacterium]|nr:UDP-N-acetylmuramate--L-alanine ligase [Acidobacteriota bacterium]MDQ7087923.1 UDP-N-acetylmuramate--L-alanine ligase [Acidobacteriota bacterium]